MRKQYHLRPSGKGFNAWDIDKLLEATKDLPVVSVNLEEIKELDENFWYQGEDDLPSCRSIGNHCKLIHEADLNYPIILSGERRVMDGMHRVVKAYILDHKTIDAVIFDLTPPPDYSNISKQDLPY
jgi:hypothetical protein